MDRNKLVLTAMIFSVAMLFIDQTIVALAVPNLQHELHLSSTGSQWIVNGYLLSLSALFALGGKIADVFGPRRMVMVGVIGFAICSALCGATPTGSIGETWMIVFRVLQGASAALLFPAALAIVVASYEVSERGKALAMFFSITGALTAVGPIAGGYLTEWTWRAIFWVNIPVAIIALVLIAISKPSEERSRSRIDMRGALLVCAGMGIAVFGLQQASVWGWSSVGDVAVPGRRPCAARGLRALRAARRGAAGADAPVRRSSLPRRQRRAVPAVDLLRAAVLLRQPLRADRARRKRLQGRPVHPRSSSSASRSARGVAARCSTARARGRRSSPAVRSPLSASTCGLERSTTCHSTSSGGTWRSPASASAWCSGRSAPTRSTAPLTPTYGAVTGLTQTVRNFGGSLGLAVLGSILITEDVSRVEKTLTQVGVPKARAETIAHAISGASRGSGPGGGGRRFARA